MSQVLIADDGTTQTANLFGLDLIASDDGATTLTMLPDGLGSVRVEMQGGAVSSATTYEPYGTLLMQTGSSGTIYGFTGEQEDATTGLTYLRARYYNPALHQFQTKDPWAGNIQQPYTLNGFNYGNGNPVRFVDLSGLCGADIGDLGIGKVLTKACEDLRDDNETEYSIRIIGEWTYSEMQAVKLGLDDIAYGLGGTEYFQTVFSGATLARSTEDYFSGYSSRLSPKLWAQVVANAACSVTGTEPPDFSTHMVATADGSGAVFYNDAMNGGTDWTRWAVIHELGHVFDARRERASKVEFWPEPNNLVYGTPSERMILYVPYNEDVGRISRYATTNASEDFAESWAATLFRGDWANMADLGRYPAPDGRKEFVQQELEAVRMETR